MLFWPGIWYGKLIFLKIIFKENFIYLKNVIWIYTCSGTPPARPPTGGHSIGRVEGLGWSRLTCIPKGFMYYRVHFISAILSLSESYLALSYAGLWSRSPEPDPKRFWSPEPDPKRFWMAGAGAETFLGDDFFRCRSLKFGFQFKGVIQIPGFFKAFYGPDSGP